MLLIHGYPGQVKVLILDAPQKMLDERRALGLGRDEMWDGVLHMVPPPVAPHQRLSSRLHVVLAPPASARGLEASMDTGLFQSEIEYRVPDQMFYRPEQASQRGAEGAELVVEVRSPGDETYEKMDFPVGRAGGACAVSASLQHATLQARRGTDASGAARHANRE